MQLRAEELAKRAEFEKLVDAAARGMADIEEEKRLQAEKEERERVVSSSVLPSWFSPSLLPAGLPTVVFTLYLFAANPGKGPKGEGRFATADCRRRTEATAGGRSVCEEGSGERGSVEGGPGREEGCCGGKASSTGGRIICQVSLEKVSAGSGSRLHSPSNASPFAGVLVGIYRSLAASSRGRFITLSYRSVHCVEVIAPDTARHDPHREVAKEWEDPPGGNSKDVLTLDPKANVAVEKLTAYQKVHSMQLASSDFLQHIHQWEGMAGASVLEEDQVKVSGRFHHEDDHEDISHNMSEEAIAEWEDELRMLSKTT